MLRHLSHILKKCLLLLAYPATLYFFLRFFLRQALGLRFGFTGTTDYDFLVPAPIAFALFIYSIEQAKPLVLKFNPWGLKLSVFSTACFLVLNALYEAASLASPTLFASAWFFLLALTLGSSFFVLLKPAQIFGSTNFVAALPCTLIATSLYLYQNAFRPFWNVLGFLTARTMHFLCAYLPLGKITSFYTAEEALRIDHSMLSIRIARGCGGGDAFFYFTLAFLLFVMVHPHKMRVSSRILSYLGGVVLMFFLNITRIFLLVFLGIGLRSWLGYETGSNYFKLFAHLHFGWILYSTGIFFYLSFCLKHLTGGDSLLDSLVNANLESAQSILVVRKWRAREDSNL